ncbi:MAG: cytochrome c [Gemmatimonadota bacterium]
MLHRFASASPGLLGLALLGCQSGPNPADDGFAEAVMEVSIPPELDAGSRLFAENCASCHGSRALGTTDGPPLVHIVYEPSHHGDLAFLLAVERGVRAHHWSFGDMPPIRGLSREEIAEIIAYVRFLQRHVGIA